MEKKTSIWDEAWKNSASQSTARHLWGLVTLTVRGEAPGATQTWSGSGGSRSHWVGSLLPFGSFSCLFGQVPLPQFPTLCTNHLTARAGSAGAVNALKNPLYGVEENPHD